MSAESSHIICGSSLFIYTKHLIKMEERRFIVGDRVKIRPGSGYHHQAPDEIGTIKGVDYLTNDDGSDYHNSWIRVKFDNDYQNSYLPSDLCYAQENDEITFKIGDKVVITKGTTYWNDDEMDQYIGQTATITGEGISPETYYTIDLDKGDWHWFPQRGHFVSAPMKGISDKDELLHRAKEMFPVGTKFFPAHLSYDKHHPQYLIITDDTEFKFIGDYLVATINGGASGCYDTTGNPKYGNCRFDRNLYDTISTKWAKVLGVVGIVSIEDYLLEEARKRYPIGTKYKNATDGREVFTVTNQLFTVVSENTIHGELGAGCLKYGGKWAEIVTDKFSIGDWVKAKDNSEYAITKNGWIGEVVNVYDNGEIRVKGKNHDGKIDSWTVHPKYFDKTSEPVESGMQYKYNVGDVLYLTESHLAVKPQQVTITKQTVTVNGKVGYRIQGWAGEFPETILSWYKSDIKDEWKFNPESKLDPQPIPPNKFEVGDWVIGLCDEYAPYSITKEGWIGKVTAVYEDGNFDARGEGNDYAGNKTYHDLNPEHFDHYSPDDDKPTQEIIDEVSALIKRGKEEEFPTTLRMSSPRVKKVSFTRI